MRNVVRFAGVIWLLSQNLSWGQFSLTVDIEKAPFSYSTTEDNNRVSRLRDQLQAKERQLEYTPERGNLQALLAALEISESSQTLVFSKTSMQVRYISSRNPRAIYFNDDTYLGWVNGSSIVEISTADPKLGTAFYTINMSPGRPKLKRADYDCLACHATTLTRGVPGHTVRSVMPTIDGSVSPQQPSFITDDRSPFAERWGGWYVTGRHGDMQHLGNSFLRGTALDTRENGNRDHLRDAFDTRHYLTPVSDIVALMVLEHQTQMHNTMTRADFFVRQLQHEMSSASTAEASPEWPEQLRMIAKEVVDRLLFSQAAAFTSEVQGADAFVEHFVARGPRDLQGRSLRDFDLKTRLFQFPCSYLIYSPTFAGLQVALREEIYGQLHQVLKGENQAIEYQHLSPKVRADILRILDDTRAGLADGWPVASLD